MKYARGPANTAGAAAARQDGARPRSLLLAAWQRRSTAAVAPIQPYYCMMSLHRLTTGS